MNEVSIIINGVRYDASPADFACKGCDLMDLCIKIELNVFDCTEIIGDNRVFKKSDKMFER